MNAQALVGLIVLVGSEAATLAQVPVISTWNTPIGWCGFIVFADGVVFRARRNSWIRTAPREFAFLALVSISLWLVFEFYNLYLENWHYVGLPETRWARLLGYGWAFATIWPAIFEGAELVSVWRGARPGVHLSRTETWLVTTPPRRRALGMVMVTVGAVLLVWPILLPSPYLAAPVFIGFVFLLDPINWALGHESLLEDLHDPHWWTMRWTNLLLSGLLCGVLWEGLNYWSVAKWHYTVPIMEDLKIFEMPLPGYLGFPAFALECFAMYSFVRGLARRLTGLRSAPDTSAGVGRSDPETDLLRRYLNRVDGRDIDGRVLAL
jgi:hypothetical protein